MFCLMGASLDTDNMGVSALAASMVKIVSTIHSDASIVLLIGNKYSEERLLKLSDNKTLPINVVNYRLSPKAKLKEHLLWILLMAFLWRIIPIESIQKKIINSTPWLESLEHADLIGEIRGGDSFSDIYGLNGFIIGSIPDLIVLLMKKNLVLLPQTYGPYQSNISRRIARYILSHAHIILSRDRESMDLVQGMLGRQNHSKQIIFCPDVAFALDSIAPQDGDIPPFINTGSLNPVIGLNINGLLYNGGYTRNNMFNLKMDYKLFVHKLSETILKETNANLLLIPHTFAPQGHIESDPDACAEVFAALSSAYKGRIQMIVGNYDQHTIKGIIGRCDFFIGSRMHACIAALSQKIPTVAVAYSKKFKGVFDSIDAGDYVIDARDEETREAVEKIGKMLEDRVQIAGRLQVQIDAAQKQQLKIFREITDGTLSVMDRKQ